MKSLLVLLIFAATASAQTISPMRQEMRGPKSKGEFTITNNSLVATTVILETKGIQGAAGQIRFGPLDSNVMVHLSEMSVRLGPKQTRIVYFESQCSMLPCTFAVFTNWIAGHTDTGLQVALHLPEIVYVCPKQKGCRDGILATWGVTPQ